MLDLNTHIPTSWSQALTLAPPHQVMSDRRTVLTKNMDGNVHLWDVHMGAPTHNFGKVRVGGFEAGDRIVRTLDFGPWKVSSLSLKPGGSLVGLYRGGRRVNVWQGWTLNTKHGGRGRL